jgi:putative endonuclease
LAVCQSDHLNKTYKNAYTKRAEDWEIFLTIECEARTQAIKVESHIKSMKSARYIKSLKGNPVKIQSLLDPFKEK